MGEAAPPGAPEDAGSAGPGVTGTDSPPVPVTGGLAAPGRGRLADPLFRVLLTACGASALVVLAAMILSTTRDSLPVFSHMGLDFFTSSTWLPGQSRSGVTGTYGAFAFIWGTLYTSAIAIIIAVPLAIGIALFLTDVLPPRIARPIQYAVEVLAAIPSVVYGLWGAVFFAPTVLVPMMERLQGTVGQIIPIFATEDGRGIITLSYFTAGNVLAIMILPIITAICREVFSQVPSTERQAAYALGATRWEVMRHVVLHRSRPGIIGATMLGLGRALGETIAVALLVGATIDFSARMFAQGYSMAAVIAVQYKEASPEHIQALVAVGVALFVITVLVNMTARLVVSRFAQFDDAAV